MIPAGYDPDAEELEVRRLFRHTFLKDGDSRRTLAVILGHLGTWSSDPDIGPGRSHLRAYGMQILECLGINHEANEMAMVFALSQVPPVEAEVKSQRSD